MANFPTFTRRGTETHNPVVGALTSEQAHDPVVRGPLSEGGYAVTRARFTRITRRWNVRYEWLSKANKNTLKTFEDSTVVGGSAAFTWTNPEDSTAYSVRLVGPIVYTPHEHANWLWWVVEFTLEQV